MPGWTLAAIFTMAVAQCYLLTFVAMAVARQIRLLDWPDKDRKLHRRATPLMGGVAVICTFLLSVLECYLAGSEWVVADPNTTRLIVMLLVSTSLLCLLGLWDDKYGMRASTKLCLQILAILPFVWFGRSTTAIDVLGWRLDLAWLGVPLILLWLVACTNFVNLMDGLDGLAGTVSLIVTLTVAALGFLQDLPAQVYLALLLGGAVAGFLIHNVPPARIFLGDSGSLPLGFLVGALAIESSVKKAAGLTFAVPLVLLSIPMFDTTMAILRRKLNGKKIGQGDRAHIHHCLRDRGLTPTQTLLAIGAMCLTTATAAVVGTVFQTDLVPVAICAGLLILLVYQRVFGFNEVVLLGRHVSAVWNFLKTVPQSLRAKFLLVRLAPTVSERQLVLWKHMLRRVKSMHGRSLEFTSGPNPAKQERVCLSWCEERPPLAGIAGWELRYTAAVEEGGWATLIATGQTPSGQQPLHLNELLEMFAAFCPAGPIEDPIRLADFARYTTQPVNGVPGKPHLVPARHIPGPNPDRLRTHESIGDAA